jgi:hypothetical protein
LIFWAFVGGFSERFVTDVISRFEGAAVKTLPETEGAPGETEARASDREAGEQLEKRG